MSGLSSFVSQHAEIRMINKVAGIMYSTATKTVEKFGVVYKKYSSKFLKTAKACDTSSDVGPV